MEENNQEKRMVDLFLDTTIKMSSIVDQNQLITFLVGRIAKIFNAEKVSCMFLDDAKQELSIKASQGIKLSVSNLKIKLGQMFAGWVAQEGKSLVVRNVEEEYPNLSKDRPVQYKTKSFVIVPIKTTSVKEAASKKATEEVIGVLSITDRKGTKTFGDDDLAIINSLCHSLAINLDNIKLAQKNASLTTVDDLTGLLNHSHFQERLTEELYRAERYHHPFSLVMLDIDDFSSYNQKLGFLAGDRALAQIAKILKDNLRRIDTAARYATGQFALILPNTKEKPAVFVGEKIKESIAISMFAQEEPLSGEMPRLTVSAGVIEYKPGLSREELLRRVNIALLEAKRKGKNCICVYK